LFASNNEIVADIVQCVTELGKLWFSKTEGISSLFGKQIVTILADVVKRADQPLSQLAALKSFGVFASQACTVPTRCAQFYKDV
jgi:hypothetical protein